MPEIIRNITFQIRYESSFDEKVYAEFKKIAKKNNRSINWFLNIKSKELEGNITLKNIKKIKIIK
jgi:hypothetical protein